MEKDLIGQKFSRLTVIELNKQNKGGSSWVCKCDCGKIVIIRASDLKKGNRKSCGCILSDGKKKSLEACIKTCTTHGLSNTREYSIWKNMISRCENPKSKSYKHYGGRGITICEEWHNIETFYKRTKESGYKDGLTIDRIDVNGNYEPNNCRWATQKEQTNNERRNIKTEFNGEIHTLGEWSEILNININTLQYRYHRGDRGDRLFRKVELEDYDKNRKAKSNTGILGISKSKNRYMVTVQYKGKKICKNTSTLEKAIILKKSIIEELTNGIEK